jgi:hypothetical protein
MSSETDHPAGSTGASPERALATRIGFAGLVPLAVLTIWLAGIPVDHVWRDMTIRLLTAYSAIVLTFLGGTRWGAALAAGHPRTARDIALGVLPALLGWIVLFIPPQYGFVLLAVAFAAQGAWDTLAGQAGTLPPWFARLRMQLTAIAVVAMIVAFAATAGG